MTQALKCTMVFGYASNGGGDAPITRTGGWTEGYYSQNTDVSAVRPIFEELCQKRALLLPSGSAVIGQRYQIVNPVAGSQIFNKLFPAAATIEADIPQMALYCKLASNTNRNTRGLKIKAIPDNMVHYGEYQPTTAFKSAVTVFLNKLSDFFCFRGRDLTQLPFPIMTVTQSTTTGVIALEDNTAYTAGQFIRVLRTRNSAGREVGGRFKISAVAGGNIVTVLDWPYGNTTGGQVRLDGVVFPRIGPTTPVRITTAKIGRPSNGYVGRRSKR